MKDDRTEAEKALFDRSKPIPANWFLRRRLLALGVPAAAVASSLVHAGLIVPNPYVQGV
jgi:hypothetical protein